MRRNTWLRRTAAALLTALWLLGLVPALGAEASSLERLLAQVPQYALGDEVFLSYADLEGLIASLPGAQAPPQGVSLKPHLETPEGKAYMRAMQGGAAGYDSLLSRLMLADEFPGSMGLEVSQIASTLVLGLPPQQLVLFGGSFDPQRVEAALENKGYQSVSPAAAGWRLWCPDGNCAAGTAMDLTKRDPGFLFGGDLGRRWPVAVSGSVLAAGEGPQPIQGLAQAKGPMLTEDANLMALLKAVAIPEGSVGQLMQLMLTTPGLPLDAPGGLLGPVALAQVNTQDALWVVLGVTYGSQELAQDAKQRLEHSVPTAQLSSGQPMSALLARFQGELRSMRVVDFPRGQGLLLVPFRFPTLEQMNAANDQAPAATPYTAFAQMLMRRDLAWLAQ